MQHPGIASYAIWNTRRTEQRAAQRSGPLAAQDELVDQMDISGSLEDLQDQNVIVYLLRVFRDKYYSKAPSRAFLSQKRNLDTPDWQRI